MANVSVVLLAHHPRRDLARLYGHRLVDHAALIGVVAHFDIAGYREVLAEGMADETVIREDATQIVVAGEQDAVQIERLALVPIDRRPHIDERIDHRKIVVGREHAQAQAPVPGNGQQVAHHREAPSFPGTVAVGRVIDAAQVDVFLESEARIIAQRQGDRRVVRGVHLERNLAQGGYQVSDALAQRVVQVLTKRIQLGGHVDTRRLAGDGIRAPDLVLQLNDSVQQRLGGRRAARHIDVDRYDAIAAAHHRIRVVIVAPTFGARAHGDHPPRLGHLVIYLAQRRRHLVAQRAGDDHDVRLARAGTEEDAEAVQIVARTAGVDHFHRATGEAERHRPHRTGARPVNQLVEGGRDETFLQYTFNAHNAASARQSFRPVFLQRAAAPGNPAARDIAVPRMPLLPVEGALGPRVDVTHHQDADEHQHFDEAEDAQAVNAEKFPDDGRPRKQERDLEIEQDRKS